MKKAAALVTSLLPAAAFAQADTNVSSGITQAIPYVQGIGIAIATCMLIFAGIKYSSGDPTAKDSAKGVVIGGILILCASGIMGLLKSWFH